MLNKNVMTFIGCDCEYEDAKIVLFGAPFDSTTSYRPGTRFASQVMRNDSWGLETYSPYQDKDMTDYLQNFSLNGKVALITGASYGIGFAIAKAMAGAGATIVFNDIKQELVDKGLAAYKEEGIEAHGYVCDVTDEDAVNGMVAAIEKEVGVIDILVNNAGNHCKKFIWDMTVEDYKRVLEVHLVGSFAMTKAVVPYMKGQKRGRIIYQASMTSYIGQPQVAGYSTSKAGFLGMIHTLTAELAEFGVTVNAIAPGWIDTPMFHQAVDNDPPRLAKIMGRIPAKTVGDPMDVGMCAAFLCSDAARYISGSCIPVDGGALIGF